MHASAKGIVITRQAVQKDCGACGVALNPFFPPAANISRIAIRRKEKVSEKDLCSELKRDRNNKADKRGCSSGVLVHNVNPHVSLSILCS